MFVTPKYRLFEIKIKLHVRMIVIRKPYNPYENARFPIIPEGH
jgi:hypothetical protein